MAAVEACSKGSGGETVTSTYPANHVWLAAPVAKPDRQVQKKITQARMVATATPAITVGDGRCSGGGSRRARDRRGASDGSAVSRAWAAGKAPRFIAVILAHAPICCA
ncbi:hypothetical protein [Arthrobacter sp. 24S4-2]|uniref:hypothetical protein n=1 Tax=Arthrobacter sp. 24S4-2 TaxID=2575374 RepID=UPI0020C7F1EF|nr:hypothetical protein [Arthrobacter sp. 24S4-2]